MSILQAGLAIEWTSKTALLSEIVSVLFKDPQRFVPYAAAAARAIRCFDINPATFWATLLDLLVDHLAKQSLVLSSTRTSILVDLLLIRPAGAAAI
jgi:hypothetical protein